jgi:hypothetical protein
MPGGGPTSFRAGASKTGREEIAMLMTIFLILITLWLLGFVSAYTLGGFLHILLILAVGVLLIRVIQGRQPI